jgi:hypothetical protein
MVHRPPRPAPPAVQPLALKEKIKPPSQAGLAPLAPAMSQSPSPGQAANSPVSAAGEMGASARARTMIALQQKVGNQATQALVSSTMPASPAQAAKPGVTSEKAAPTQSAPSGELPGFMSKPKTGSRALTAPSAEAKAGATKSKAPSGKASAGPAAVKAPAGVKEGKASDAQAAAPNARAAIGPAISAVRQRASKTRKHSAAGSHVASAQAAARKPQVEQKRTAAAQTVKGLDEAKAEEVKRDKFKAKLKKAIEDATPKPKTESQADELMKNGAGKASGTLRSTLSTERDAAVGPMKSAAATEVPASSQPAPPEVTLQSEPVGPPPAPVSAAPVVPAPLPPERLDYSADRGPTDQVMAENNVTKDQMQNANDPAFGPTLEARSSAEKHEATAEARYRQGETKVQDQAQAAATQTLAKDLAGMHGTRAQQIGKVVTQQQGTKTKDAQERQRITDTIAGIKDKTRTEVEAILKSMEDEAGKIFEAGLQRAEKGYEDTFEEAKGGVGTWLTTWGSDWEKLIENSLAKARREYMHQVDLAIDEVSAFVDGKLKAAKQRVADGRKEVEKFVSGLDARVMQFGEEALKAVSADFDTMGSEIDQRRDGLISKLTEQYKNSYQRMSAMEEKLREANKSLWQRVYDATVGLIKKIIEFKNMLVSTLAKAASVIGDIIAHPIRFLSNLVSGVMQGLKNFMSKLPTYLLKGIMDWLFGALAGAGLQLPDKFDLQGIISIVLQIFGLTYANFRARAVAIVGEPIVAAIEKTAEVFKVIVTDGVSGLWRFIKEQLTDLKSMVLDAIFSYIKDKVIMAGITWVIGLLNPASAFFKACKAIYDIIVFFVTRGKQILDLVNAIIDSVAAIVAGNVGVAAAKVESALAKAIPVAIGFLASLLGLGDPSKPVKEFIEKARAPVNKAIDWVINLAVKAVKAAGKWVMGLVSKKDDKKETTESKGVKENIHRELMGKKVQTFTQEQTLINAIYSKYAPKGLKGIEFHKRESKLVVKVSASAAEEVAQLDLTIVDHRKRLKQIIERLRYLVKGSTYILVYYNGEHFSDVKNQGAHAETGFVNKTINELRNRMLEDISGGKLDRYGKVNIHWDMSRSPCKNCAEVRVSNILPLLKQGELKDLNIKLTISASAIDGKTGYEGLEQILDPKHAESIEIKATDIWDIIQAKIRQYPTFFDHETRLLYTVDQFDDYRSKAATLQATIDEIVKSNKDNPKPTKQGSI